MKNGNKRLLTLLLSLTIKNYISGPIHAGIIQSPSPIRPTKPAILLEQDESLDHLLQAVNDGMDEAVFYILESGSIAVNTIIDANGMTLLHKATARNNPTIIAGLLRVGADASLQDKFGNNALQLAHNYHKHRAIAGLQHALLCAAINKNGGLTRRLIAAGFDVNYRLAFGIFTGWSPLHVAAKSGYAEIANTLLTAGARVNTATRCGDTPLHIAAQEGNTNVVRLLLTFAANINATNKHGQTPLQLARINGHNEIAALLRAKKA